MAIYKPRERKLINRIDNQEDGEESNQTFQLHTLLVFTFLTSFSSLYGLKAITQIFKDGKDRVFSHMFK